MKTAVWNIHRDGIRKNIKNDCHKNQEELF
jgi:hypothetical protein